MESSRVGADLGILGSGRQQLGNDAESRPSATREDVFEALQSATLRGGFCAGDRADGTTTAPSLPTTLGLRIAGMGLPSGGDAPLPVTDAVLKAIKAKAAKVAAKSFHNVYEVDPKKVRIQNPAWGAALEELKTTVAFKMGVRPSSMTAEFDRLLLMGKGSRIDRCSMEESSDVLGTLLIQLPSKFTGGEISIFSICDDEYEEEDEGDGEEDEEGEERASTFDFSAPGGEFACHFVSHFSDVEFEVAKIKSGSRVLLRYSLLYRGQNKPTANLVLASMAELEWSLANLPPVERMVLVPLASEYHASVLVNRGINALTDQHRASAEAIMAATKGWQLLILNAKMKHKHVSWGTYGDVSDSNNTSSVISIFDEAGNNVSSQMKWLKNVVEFDSVTNEGMMLTCDKSELFLDDIFADDWGRCKAEKHSSTGNERDDYYNRYRYDDRDVSHTTEKMYRSSFLLAFCVNAEPELKALGGREGTAEIAKKVVATRDYHLLERLMSVVSAKKKSELDVRSCHVLLQMLTRATGKEARNSARVAMASEVISGLGDSLEPSTELYEMMLSAVDRFGHDGLAGSLSKLWSSYNRKRGLELVGFLHRAEFALEMDNRVEGGATNYVDQVVRALSSHGKPTISNSGDVNKVLLALIGKYGSTKMSSVVKATLRSLDVAASKKLVDLLNRSILLSRLESAGECDDFINGCIFDFTKAFVKGLAADYSSKTTLSLLTGADNTFLKAVHYVIEYGGKDEQRQFGDWMASKKDRFSALLKALAKADNGMDMVQNILNKCLVHHPVSKYGWPSHKKEDGSVPASTHVRLILEAYPDVASKPDRDGRFTLHYAAESDSAPFEVVLAVFRANPKAASVPDPLSGLFPFMLAASKETSSFRLLLADPNLVLCGVQADANVGKKRKRSISQG